MASEEIKRAKKEYTEFLKSIDPNTRKLMDAFIKKTIDAVGSGELSLRDLPRIKKQIANASKEFNKDFKDVIRTKSMQAIGESRKAKSVQYVPYLNKARKELMKTASAKIADEILGTPAIKKVLGGGLDERILSKVWNKVWKDKLTVDDRTLNISKRLYLKAEEILKNGIAEGFSAEKIGDKLKGYFAEEGIEKRICTRLAASTIGQCYNAAQSAIAVETVFVEGILVERADDGDESCPICESHANLPGEPGKEYYKEQIEGGGGYDLFVLNETSPFHANCKCTTSDIVIPIERFIQEARQDYAESKGYASWNEMTMNG